jgi:hypothetical protein
MTDQGLIRARAHSFLGAQPLLFAWLSNVRGEIFDLEFLEALTDSLSAAGTKSQPGSSLKL